MLNYSRTPFMTLVYGGSSDDGDDVGCNVNNYANDDDSVTAAPVSTTSAAVIHNYKNDDLWVVQMMIMMLAFMYKYLDFNKTLFSSAYDDGKEELDQLVLPNFLA